MLTSQNERQYSYDELVILVTPHVVSGPERSEAPEIWLSK